MYAMGLIAPFAREDQSKPPLQVQYNYVEITEEIRRTRTRCAKFLASAASGSSNLYSHVPSSWQIRPAPLALNDEPKCTEGAVMCILSQRQSLVSIAGEVLKKHYGADSKEQCYKQMFQDSQQTAVAKRSAPLLCAERRQTDADEYSEDVDDSTLCSSPILQTHQIINAIDSDDKNA